MAKRQKQAANELEQIEAFFSTENEHRNKFFFKLYNEAVREQIFESPLIPMQNIDRLITACYTGRAKPLQTAKGVIADIHLFNWEQKMFIYHLLVEYLETTGWTDKDGKEISLPKIKDLLDAEFMYLQNPDAKHTPTNNNPTFDFDKVKQHLETLPDIKEKIKYLIEQKTLYKQQDGYDFDISPTFADKCELEIKKMKALAEMESTPTQPKAKPQLGGYTNAQLVLIFYYFFKQNGLEPRVSIDISPIAKFIHLITGKEFKAVTSSDFYKKLQTVPNFKTDKELINDLETIKPLFKMVQLNEVVKMIENEIDLARNEVKQAKKK